MLNVVEKSLHKESKKYLLIFTDGGDKKDFSKEIKLAKKYNITVFILGMGTIKGAPVKQKDGTFIEQNGKILISKLNTNISSLATKTGGVYIQNTLSDKDIKAMFKEINARSSKKELKSEDVQRYIPLFYYPVGLALLLLLIATSSLPLKLKKVIPLAFIIFAFSSTVPNARAGVLDFMHLDNAQKAYKDKDYDKSAKIYQDYAQKHSNSKAFYNAGDSFYKEKKYKEAVKAYKSANFTNKEEKAKKLSNLGNAYAKQGTQKELENAKKAYEESLKLQKDKDTQKNLDTVNKLLQKKKNKQNKQNKKKDSKNKKKSQNNKKNQNSKNKSNSNKSKDSKNNNDSKKKKNSKQNSSNKQKNKQNSKNDAKKKQKQNLKQLSKNKKNPQKKKGQSVANMSKNAKKMTSSEEKKWLHMMNKQQNSFMYMLGKQQPKKEDINEKPW